MAATEHKISPREIYQVFSSNLQFLVAQSRGSVTRICREIGVNRTQFNRYLAGQASPRPDILHRICQYFHVDARVLLEPITTTRQDHARDVGKWGGADHPLVQLLLKRDQLTLTNPVPLGLHRYWQRSFLDPNWVNSYTMRVFDMSGATVFRIRPDPRNDKITTSYSALGVSEMRGFFISQVDGVVMIACKPDNHRLSISYLTRMTTDSPILSGIAMMTRPELSQATRVERCVLEVLPQTNRLLATLRGRGGRVLTDLPDFIAHGLRGEVR